MTSSYKQSDNEAKESIGSRMRSCKSAITYRRTEVYIWTARGLRAKWQSTEHSEIMRRGVTTGHQVLLAYYA